MLTVATGAEWLFLAAAAWLSLRALWGLWIRPGRFRPSPDQSASLQSSELRYLRRWFSREWEIPASLALLASGLGIVLFSDSLGFQMAWMVLAVLLLPALLIIQALRPAARILELADGLMGKSKERRGRTLLSLYRNSIAYRGLPHGERFKKEFLTRLVNFDPWSYRRFPAGRALSWCGAAFALVLLIWLGERAWPKGSRELIEVASAETPDEKSLEQKTPPEDPPGEKKSPKESPKKSQKREEDQKSVLDTGMDSQKEPRKAGKAGKAGKDRREVPSTEPGKKSGGRLAKSNQSGKEDPSKGSSPAGKDEKKSLAKGTQGEKSSGKHSCGDPRCKSGPG